MGFGVGGGVFGVEFGLFSFVFARFLFVFCSFWVRVFLLTRGFFSL